MDEQVRPYISGPLTEFAEDQREQVKRLYEKIADCCQRVFGIRAFVPHEHFDPVKMPDATPKQVDEMERHRVCKLTSILIVVPISPSWGGGIEVEMAYRSGIPVLILVEREKLENKRISRLLLGNPGVIKTLTYGSEEELLANMIDFL